MLLIYFILNLCRLLYLTLFKFNVLLEKKSFIEFKYENYLELRPAY